MNEYTHLRIRRTALTPLQVTVALPAVLWLAVSTTAGAIYSTGFESPPLEKESPLVGQDGWVAPALFSPGAAVIGPGRHMEGKQSVRVRGRDLEHQDFINTLTGGYYDALGSYRRAVDYDTGGTQIVRVSAFVLVQGPPTPAGQNFFSASVAARVTLTDGDTAGAGELAISSDGHVYGHCGCENAPTFLVSAPISLNAWHELALELDLGERTYSFFVDGQYLGNFNFLAPPDPEDPTIDYTTVLRRGSILAYAAPDAATRKKREYNAWFDAFAIEVVGGP